MTVVRILGYENFYYLFENSLIFLFDYSRGRIYYTEMYDMLKNMDPPLGFGSKCPDRLAFKKLIRMNMPIDDEGMVHFTTTLFALIRENLSIKMRAAEEMDQADFELRQTIIKVWPYEGKEKIDLLVPPREGILYYYYLYTMYIKYVVHIFVRFYL